MTKAVWLTVALLLLSVAAHAGPEDDAAERGIKDAISVHYLATAFDKAEAALLEVSKECAGRCSAETLARVQVYVGLVRGVGREDKVGARKAFAEALKLHPEVALDRDLTTPEVTALFEAVKKNPSAPAEGPLVIGGMHCSFNAPEVQTRRPIPIACRTDQPATKAEIKYKEFGSTEWKTVHMGSAAGQWLGTIPCSATDQQGVLRWYVNARDQGGEVLDNHGAQRQPLEVQLIENSSAPPPAYPDQDPPTRCGAVGECPTEMLGTPACPGTVKPTPGRGSRFAGDACQFSRECMSGLDCVAGHCEAPRSCERDSDCTVGRCVDQLCQAAPPIPSTHQENWLGLHFVVDLAIVSGQAVCEDPDFACYYGDGSPHGANGETFDGANSSAGDVQSGFALGTLRVLAAYERLLTSKLGLEARAGFAFNGAPSAASTSFMPVHLEARAKYWLLGAPASQTVAPYVFAGGGLAQVDAKVSVVIAQNIACNEPPSDRCLDTPEVDAYRQMGVGFATVGGGALFALGPNYGINLNLNALFLFPKAGFSLQPALGFNYGF